MENAQGSMCCGKRSVAIKIVGIIALAAVAVVAIAKDDIWYQAGNSIQVVGQGRVPVSPDAALVNFGVLVVQENTAEEAIQKAAESMKNVNAALETVGISKEDRQMTGYAVNPLFESGDASATAGFQKKIIGYTASQQVTVLIRSIDQDNNMVNAVVSAAMKAGANQVGEVRMVATNAEALKQKARVKALSDAREKVTAMAKVSDVKLTGVTSWYENIVATPGTQESTSNSYAPTPTTILPTSTPWGVAVLQPGQLDIVVEMTVNYGVHE